MAGANAAAPKRRKQNQSCDTCKHRRVRCDLAEKIAALSSAAAEPPAIDPLDDPSILPPVPCTNCDQRGIVCTTNEIKAFLEKERKAHDDGVPVVSKPRRASSPKVGSGSRRLSDDIGQGTAGGVSGGGGAVAPAGGDGMSMDWEALMGGITNGHPSATPSSSRAPPGTFDPRASASSDEMAINIVPDLDSAAAREPSSGKAVKGKTTDGSVPAPTKRFRNGKRILMAKKRVEELLVEAHAESSATGSGVQHGTDGVSPPENATGREMSAGVAGIDINVTSATAQGGSFAYHSSLPLRGMQMMATDDMMQVDGTPSIMQRPYGPGNPSRYDPMEAMPGYARYSGGWMGKHTVLGSALDTGGEPAQNNLGGSDSVSPLVSNGSRGSESVEPMQGVNVSQGPAMASVNQDILSGLSDNEVMTLMTLATSAAGSSQPGSGVNSDGSKTASPDSHGASPDGQPGGSSSMQAGAPAFGAYFGARGTFVNIQEPETMDQQMAFPSGPATLSVRPDQQMRAPTTEQKKKASLGLLTEEELEAIFGKQPTMADLDFEILNPAAGAPSQEAWGAGFMGSGRMFETALRDGSVYSGQPTYMPTPNGAMDDMFGTPAAMGGFGSGFGGFLPSQDVAMNMLFSPSGLEDDLKRGVLGKELCRHLINVCFQAVHSSIPAIDPNHFRAAFNTADQNPANMGNAGEVLCAALAAWGARYSADPVVLGLGRNGVPVGGNVSPFVRIEGGSERLMWGKAREPACRALAQRAQRLLDERGLMRRPERAGLQAILLISAAIRPMNPDGTIDHAAYLECVMLDSALAEQCKLLGLVQLTDFSSTRALSSVMSDVRQHRIFWSVWIRDAFMTSGRRAVSRFETETILTRNLNEEYDFEEIIGNVNNKGPPDENCYKIFVGIYAQVGRVARIVNREILIPLNHPEGEALDSFVSKVNKYWNELEDCMTAFEAISHRLAPIFKKADLGDGFSPLMWVLNVRLTFQVFCRMLGNAVEERHSYEQRIKAKSASAFISPEGSPDDFSEYQNAFTGLMILLPEARTRSLNAMRKVAKIIRTVLPSGALQIASGVLAEVFEDSSLHLAKHPTIEQGFPLDASGDHFTWQKKMEYIRDMTEGLQQKGWAWSHVEHIIARIEKSMVDTQPEGMISFKQYMASSKSKSSVGAKDALVDSLLPFVVSREIVAERGKLVQPFVALDQRLSMVMEKGAAVH